MTSSHKKQIPEFHHKNWGAEYWIANNEKYCGKLLFFKEGKKCSWHFHKIKEEHFYLHSGELLVQFSEQDDMDKAESVVLLPGESFHIPVGLRHRMTAIKESQLFEFSTQHFEDDSIRLIKGD